MRDFLVQSAVAGISGGVILMLAALGIYGVVGLMVATRTREIAVPRTKGAEAGAAIRGTKLELAVVITDAHPRQP